jgi:CubicO group peptidase (beta-lactamase class C family)
MRALNEGSGFDPKADIGRVSRNVRAAFRGGVFYLWSIDVRVPAVPTLLQLRNLFDGIPICRAQRTIAAFIPALELLIAEAMDEWKIPGLAVAVVQNGEVALVKAYGLRDANDAMAPGHRRPPGRPSDPI